MNTSTYKLHKIVMVGITGFAADNGLDADNAGHFARRVNAYVRDDIDENGKKEIDYTTKTGSEKTAKAKDVDPRWRATGKGVNQKLKLGGGREEILTAKCSFLTRSLSRQNDVIVELEREGYAMQWGVEPDSETAYGLKNLLKTFKTVQPIPAQPIPVPA